jgi:hypothetical protein
MLKELGVLFAEGERRKTRYFHVSLVFGKSTDQHWL